ncbi:hypothetical protein AB0F17_18150 [Nonomuraea sp. NPDC026600]|uniref:hypothetical protein n=1 Tax=Nonomuraea sp. NPDC026600 TaxID=3155363 RepID=UPI0033C9C278
MANAPEPALYVPDCDIVKIGDGTLLVTHLGSGHVRTAANGRQALIVGTGLAIAYTWQTALKPCPPKRPPGAHRHRPRDRHQEVQGVRHYGLLGLGRP